MNMLIFHVNSSQLKVHVLLKLIDLKYFSLSLLLLLHFSKEVKNPFESGFALGRSHELLVILIVFGQLDQF